LSAVISIIRRQNKKKGKRGQPDMKLRFTMDDENVIARV